MEIRTLWTKLTHIFTLFHNLFPYALILYLILFLLENLFPGFVSNNFDLNMLLIAVLIFGVFFVMAPIKEHIENKPEKSDKILILTLAIISFLVLLYKGKDTGLEGLAIALGGSALIAFTSIVTIYLPDEESENEVVVTQVNVPETQKIFNGTSLWVKYRKYAIPAICLVTVGILFTGWKPNKNTPKEISENIIPTVTIVPVINDVVTPPSVEMMKNVSVEVLNGSVKIGSASAIAKILKEKKFNIKKVSDADRYDYQYTILRFRPEEYEVAKYLIDTIHYIYPNVIRAPLESDKANIILILGRP